MRASRVGRANASGIRIGQVSKRSKSSGRWLAEHHADEYVRRARVEGWRSRAVYKLIEAVERSRLIRPGMTVVDLGAAPGGWSQYVAGVLGGNGRVIALDILPMDPLPGVEVIEGDFREEAVLDNLMERLGDTGADVVLSDMAPNLSGVGAVDQPRAMYLAELALDTAGRVLGRGGSFYCKVFQGEGFDDFVRDARRRFSVVKVKKPKASRPRSREVYLLATDHKV